jgi:hypothetical protein
MNQRIFCARNGTSRAGQRETVCSIRSRAFGVAGSQASSVAIEVEAEFETEVGEGTKVG